VRTLRTSDRLYIDTLNKTAVCLQELQALKAGLTSSEQPTSCGSTSATDPGVAERHWSWEDA
jgi:hypothetical protein